MRHDTLNDAFTTPPPEIIPGVKIRRISLQTLSMLTRIGSPIADLKKTATAADDLSLPQLAEFIFIHGADPAEVRRVVYSAPFELAEKADEFCAAIPPEKIPSVLAAITGDAQAIQAAQAKAIPDPTLPASKNAQSPAA